MIIVNYFIIDYLQYKPFTMGCHVSEDDYQILWLKNGNNADWISRERVEETRNSTAVTFTFTSPNESDLGKLPNYILGIIP